MENKVMVESLTTGRIGITIPELRLRRTWERKGAKIPVDFEVLQEAIYYPGVEYMFKEGLLGIESMEHKIALGLEPEGAEAPTEIIILTDTQRKRLLTIAPLAEFKEMVKKLPREQINELVTYAVQNKLTDYERCEILREITGVNIVKAIELDKASKEE